MRHIIMNLNADNVDVDFYFVKKFSNLSNLSFDVMYEPFPFTSIMESQSAGAFIRTKERRWSEFWITET